MVKQIVAFYKEEWEDLCFSKLLVSRQQTEQLNQDHLMRTGNAF